MATKSLVGKLRAPALLALGAGVWLARRRRNFFSLRGKNVLITGGARGLGLELARRFVEKGANVAIVARDREEVARALGDLQQHAPSAARLVGETCDLRDGDAIDALLVRLGESFGAVDVLVNNAGVIQVGPLDTMNLADFEDAMRLHYFAPLKLMLALRADMRARGGGRIANISSIGGVVSVPHLLPYCGSKFALIGLSQGMRSELARDGIKVSTVAPGLMRTGSPRGALFKGDHRKEYAWFAISDSLPGLSVSSGRAARRIVRALEHGEAHVVIGWSAKLATLLSGLAPRLIAQALTAANSALPRGSDPHERRGFESESKLAPSVLTALSERAATLNNER